jgi:hypothetical protein
MAGHLSVEPGFVQRLCRDDSWVTCFLEPLAKAIARAKEQPAHRCFASSDDERDLRGFEFFKRGEKKDMPLMRWKAFDLS